MVLGSHYISNLNKARENNMDAFFVAVCDTDQRMSKSIKKWIEEYGEANNLIVRVDLFETADEFCPVVEKDVFYDMILFNVALPKNKDTDKFSRYGVFVGAQLRKRTACNRVFIEFVGDEYETKMPLMDLKPLNFRKKPLSKKQIWEDVERALAIIQMRKSFLTYKRGPFLEQINMQDVTYFEVKNKNLYVHTLNGRIHSFTATLDEIEQEYEELPFVRCHSSYVVNTLSIIHYQDGMLTLRNGDVIAMEDEYSKRIMR